MKFSSLALLFVSPMLLASSLSAVEIIAHRGASFDAPENTLASLNLGWKQNADACELDVYLTKDGQLVLLHDATLKRTAGVEKKVVEMTLEELRALDVGSWKGETWKGEKVPTLAEALATIPEGKTMYIEVKCGPEIMPELTRVLAASQKKPEQLAIISFDYEVVKQSKAALPQSPVYYLASNKQDKKTGKPKATIEELIEKATAAKLDGLDLDTKFPIDETFVKKINAAGLKLYVWTVNEGPLAKQLKTAGVNGITTDRPEFLRDQLK